MIEPHADAVLSDDGTYRYLLTRRWSWPTDRHSMVATWIMLNPSTADATRDDNTIRRCIRFSRDWGCDSLQVVNLFAYRSTSQAALWAVGERNGVEHIVGPDCDQAIRTALFHRQGPVVAAWGAAPAAGARATFVRHLALELDVDLQCIGTTRLGAPRHPLYVRADIRLEPWPTS